MSTMEGPCSILGMLQRLFGLFFTMFPLFLASFSGIYLVSWHAREPGEGKGALRNGPLVFSSGHVAGCSEEGEFPDRELNKENNTA